MNKNLKVLSPFGPKLAKLKLPQKKINLINKEIDRIISNKKIYKGQLNPTKV